MSEVDPDPYEPGEGQREVQLGGAAVPEADDPTLGGKSGEIGSVPSVVSDEPDAAGEGYPVGGGRVADPGADA